MTSAVPDSPTVSATWSPRRVVIWVVSAVAVAAPALRMTSFVRGGSETQYADYWMMVPTVFRSDGWLSISGLFHLRNEHPIAGAKILYWLNYKVTGGSNITLGYVVILMVVLQVVVIACLIRRDRALPVWTKAMVVVVFASVAFSRHGGWNFIKAMSGTAWLGASLLTVAAIFFERSPRRWPSILLGFAASFTYGTGLMVWPALLVTGYARDRRVRRHWPPALAGLVMFLIYIRMPGDATVTAQEGSRFTDVLYRAGLVLGSVLAGDRQRVDVTIAAVMVVVGVGCAVWLFLRRDEAAAPWIGLFVWGISCAALVVTSRSPFIAEYTTSRYYSIGLMTLTAVVAMAAIVIQRVSDGRRFPVLPGAVLAAVVASGIAVVSWSGGASVVPEEPVMRADADLLAVTLRIGVAHGSKRWTVLEAMPPVEGLLEEIGHFPFDGSSSVGCGMIDRSLSAEMIVDPPAGLHATQARIPMESVPNSVWISGRATVQPDCILVTDARKKVIGAGVWYPAIDETVDPFTYAAVAPPDIPQYRVYVRFRGSPGFVRISSAF